ncbi:MAG: ribosome assembly cofactor RimP [Flavobacteriaceae bacterium]|nr:ribosome assembly cofactor RimP [Flavobacteriaceae bacterium]
MNNFFENLVDDYLKANNNLFLVNYFIDSNNKVNIIIDGDSGVTISDCVKLSKHLKKNIEDYEDISFEVGSAGLLSPIISFRQFLKNLNRKLNVKSNGGEDFTGNLSEVNRDGIIIEWCSREPKPIGKGKITVLKSKSLPFNDIKEAKLIVEF